MDGERENEGGADEYMPSVTYNLLRLQGWNPEMLYHALEVIGLEWLHTRSPVKPSKRRCP